ncbi:hypothetical protein N7539_005900 [Penicillium diatomitis]|uniref:phosphatidylinositol-3,4,5-trisphosphate 3-phosphatase n=1 Tax=Penicillium diatomitis TaxID=2819901 RepID=A0A9X0BUE9_9EURO|nr:uncharacterized protein N7539_005900 [Penicillium diatomitis]KAJ5484104.1 hypothetical protein N7539_005900 [Penicillium diatomitis]
MASILRQIVAGPRLKHPEAGLDLCYVTDDIIATSGPSGTYPQRAYRNPLDELVKFLDYKHGANWCIWEFRAEGTGYPDSEVYNRIHHFPWPDHHPPPFALIPKITASIREWLRPEETQQKEHGPMADAKQEFSDKRVAVVHCKAGKGRSGTIATSYLISQEGWAKDEALQRFTQRRMRVGFGNGVSIPSQLRYVGYVDRWTNQLGKRYVDRPVEILEIHTWGLRDGVKVIVQGYEEEGRKIKSFHLFHRHERTVVEAGDDERPIETVTLPTSGQAATDTQPSTTSLPAQVGVPSSASELSTHTTATSNLSAIIFRPQTRIIIPNSDVNIDFERRSKASYTGFAMVTSVAHVWFNAFFEGGDEFDSGVFEMEWDAMDGIKGSARKGIRSFQRMKVVWKYPSDHPAQAESHPSATEQPLSNSKPRDPAMDSHAPWLRGKGDGSSANNAQGSSPSQTQGQEKVTPSEENTSNPTDRMLLAVNEGSLHELQRQLGLRKQTDESKDVSLAGTDDETRAMLEEEALHKKRNVVSDRDHPESAARHEEDEGIQPYLGHEGEEGGAKTLNSRA